MAKYCSLCGGYVPRHLLDRPILGGKICECRNQFLGPEELEQQRFWRSTGIDRCPIQYCGECGRPKYHGPEEERYDGIIGHC
jgi:hypothetical protein